MLRLVAFGAGLLVVLAGCSSRPTEVQQSSAPTFTVSADAGLPPPPSLTDTLHLLEGPHLAASLPGTTEPYRTPVASEFDTGSESVHWSLPRPQLATLSATVMLWVDVEGTVVNAGSPCFWGIFLVVEQENGWTGTTDCVDEPQLVPTGEHLIQATFELNIANVEGKSVGLFVESGAVASPGSSVSILGGTADRDSTLHIVGLQVPLDTRTLLQ